jgi:hypothetical protein
LREHWRSLLVAVRGKLQSVESGISTFEQEFDRFLVPHFAGEKKQRNRKAPKAVNWLLGGSHSLAIALVAAFLVPASAVGAFALPTNVVGHLSAPFRETAGGASAVGQGGTGLALARGGWSPVSGNAAPATTDADHLFAFRAQQLATVDDQLRQEASLSSPPVDGDTPQAPAQPSLASAGAPSPISISNPPSSPPSPAARPPAPHAPAASDESSAPPSATPSSDDAAPSTPPAGSGSDSPSSDPAAEGSDQPTTPASDPSSGDPSNSSPADQPAGSGSETAVPSAPGNDPAPGNGNGNGNGNGDGNTPPGQSGSTPPGQSGNTPPGQSGNTPRGQSNPPANGNGNGNANGQNGTQGQGNGQKTGGKVKGGK